MKKFIFTFLLMLCITLLFSQVNPANYSGSGTATDPYRINSVNDLENLNLYLGSQYANVYFKLMNDLNLSGTGFSCIGRPSAGFYGVFDGNYHEISNLSGNDRSLFYLLLRGGVIKNVIMRNANITTTQSAIEMGILVQLNDGLIENCFAHGKITAGADISANGKGGITGYNGSGGKVRNCFVDVEVIGRQRIGGVVGKNHGIVEYCYSTGKLTCSSQINGGVVGYSDNIVRNCVNIIPTITGQAATGTMGTYRVFSYSGTGTNNYSLNTTTINGSTISSGTTTNYNGQNVTVTQLKTRSFWESIGYDFSSVWQMSDPNGPYKGYPVFKGQEAGCQYKIYTVSDLINLSNEVNSGDSKAGCTYLLMNDLNLSGTSFSSVGRQSAGFSGVFDGNYHEISNLSGNDKSLFYLLLRGGVIKNVIMRNANITTTQSAIEMGILVQLNDGLIENCFAHGKITAGADISANGKGGITGYNGSGGKVRNCFVDVEVIGRQRIGGVVGKNHGIVEYCYSTGKLTCSSQINGGVVGYSDNIVRNCVNIIPTITGQAATGTMGTYRVFSYSGTGANNYSLNTTTINGSTISSGTTTNYNGQNATTTQLKTRSFWESIGYDFNSVWKMSDPNGPYKGYPIFKGQEAGCQYKIYTVSDLINLSNEVNSGDSKAGCTYLLMNDLNLSGTGFSCIGRPSAGFSGVFDGNYHEISNLSGNDRSLFYLLLRGGVIKNVIMRNANITTTQSAIEMGILVQLNDGLIENCFAHGKITAGADISANGKGGITGYNGSGGKVRNCFVDVEVIGRQRIGGVVGKNHGIVEYCYSTGKLTCSSQINGGVVGYSDNIVRNCVNIIPTITGQAATGTMGTYRVFSYSGTGANNYSLNTTTINGSTISSGTTTNYNGQNATTTQLKTRSFWESIGYDFSSIWKMSDPNGPYKGYPIFKGQADVRIATVLEELNYLSYEGQQKVYPNPTSDIVTIESDDENPDIIVYNMNGQLLLRTTKKIIDLSSYINGIYIFNINGEIVKVVKQ